MKIIDYILNFTRWGIIDKEMVKNLYLYSEKSLLSVIVITLLVLVVLSGTSLGEILYYWGAAIILFSLYRLSHAIQFKKDPERYSLEKWHKIFIIDAIFLVLLANILALLMLPQVEQIYQLFILIVFLGLSGGSVQSLSPDYKLSLLYQGLALIPVAIMLILQGHELNYYAALIVPVYFMTQLNIIRQEHKQVQNLLKKEQEIVSVEKLLEEKQNRLEYFFTEHPLAVMSYDIDLIVTDCNIEAVNLFDNKNLLGLDLHDLKDDRPLEAIRKSLTQGSQVYRGPYHSLEGIDLWIEIKCLPVMDSTNKVTGGIVIIENKTKEYKAYQDLEYHAYHDTLTSLPNRRGFMHFIDNMIHDELHETHNSLLFYIDLNRFKHINDSLGHTVGDQLLIEVSRRLKENIDTSSSLSRLGGDEFIIVIPFISNNKATAKRYANNFALKIQELIREVFVVENMRLYIKASIGIVNIEPGSNDIEEIVRQADISMYEAKEHGQNEYISFYNTALDIERKNVFSLQHDLVYGLKNDQFKLHFQPIVNIKDDTVYGAEALIRWHHPTKGLVAPDEFIPLAVESGAIMDIDWWVIDTVCKQIGQWKKDNIWKLHYVSFNLNAHELLRTDFVHNFLAKLAEYNVEKNDIKIEITETSLVDNFEDSHDVISILHQYGVRCAIDDFGTGYSSLAYLKRLSFNTLKIDREFIRDIDDENEDTLLMRNIISIGKQFNYDIVVEGVEEEKQRETIASIDDDLLYQGYLFSPAINVEAFESKFLKD
ncbi:EAL domain-containing protein [Sulfurovum sp.]|uniref:putative bifunctional diguanylate cyclase/phosphodiesterase n=1 Tax=Sulfurovum sp. TaxID=1969726 RepID=UPI002867F03D|nr:EAL domain-containing protein [Sulfurovum sp.]